MSLLALAGGVYWEPRYKAINTASTQSAYSGGHNNNVYSDVAAGQTWSYPSAVIANNRLKGRAGDTSLSSKGIEIVPKTINFGIWGCSLTPKPYFYHRDRYLN